jgi:hypothetical protein
MSARIAVNLQMHDPAVPARALAGYDLDAPLAGSADRDDRVEP